MKYFSILFLGLSTLLINCDSSNSENTAGFVTLLGNDTLAIEKFTKTDSTLYAKVILRSPRTTLTSYNLEVGQDGGVENLSYFRHNNEAGFDGDKELVRSYERNADSLKMQVLTNDGTMRTITSKYQEGTLPFIDMVHWPFEVAFNNAMNTSADSIDQKLLSGSRTGNFIIAKIRPDSMTIRHPSRGVMGVNVDSKGNIKMLDASQTTRKLTVKRVDNVDIDKIAARFVKSDEQGNPFGSLSGAVEQEFIVGNTAFNVSYGSPLRRGRDLFGGIVSYGQRWRTGANRATHFSTSSDLTIGGLNVPAGEYTLFTIPEPDGGTLIINKQTGQNGRTYDQERDLGRVPMNVETKPESTEAFTITVEENGNGGVLKLIWGNTVYSVDFDIK